MSKKHISLHGMSEATIIKTRQSLVLCCMKMMMINITMVANSAVPSSTRTLFTIDTSTMFGTTKLIFQLHNQVWQ